MRKRIVEIRKHFNPDDGYRKDELMFISNIDLIRDVIEYYAHRTTDHDYIPTPKIFIDPINAKKIFNQREEDCNEIMGIVFHSINSQHTVAEAHVLGSNDLLECILTSGDKWNHIAKRDLLIYISDAQARNFRIYDKLDNWFITGLSEMLLKDMYDCGLGTALANETLESFNEYEELPLPITDEYVSDYNTTIKWKIKNDE